MTGKELIMYILANNLENEQVFKNGVFVGFMSVEEAAVKLGVGVNSIHSLIALGQIDCIRTDVKYFIPANFKKKGE